VEDDWRRREVAELLSLGEKLERERRRENEENVGVRLI
jgi:hypothetical protein